MRDKSGKFIKGHSFGSVTQFKKGQSPWNKGVKGVYVKERSFAWKGGKPNCIECNKLLANRGTELCLSCSHKGERGSGWKGGITKINKIQREKFRNQMQKTVFERDNYTCQLCGDRNGNGKTVILQVDHIQSWKEYVNLRFSIDNCRTLCMKCHYKVTYGKEMSNKVGAWGQNFKHINKEVFKYS